MGEVTNLFGRGESAPDPRCEPGEVVMEIDVATGATSFPTGAAFESFCDEVRANALRQVAGFLREGTDWIVVEIGSLAAEDVATWLEGLAYHLDRP